MPRTVLYRLGALVQAPTPTRLEVVRDAYVLAGPDGRVRALARWGERADVGVDEVVDLSPLVATPGFVDAHVHLPQLDVRGQGSAELLDWLKTTIFPEEARFLDAQHARFASRRFFRALLHFGTVAAGVYLPGDETAAREAFREAARFPLRLVMGKTLMDRNVPRALADRSPEDAIDASLRLADEFHSNGNPAFAGGNLRYAMTPRFAPACTPRLMSLAARAAEERGLHVQTHLSETRAELEWVRTLFPGAPDYLAVYESAGLAGPRTVFGHGIHLDAAQWTRLGAAGSWVAHCPLSNEALKSGRLALESVPHDARVALATDVGASPSLSMLDAMGRARDLHPPAAAGPARLLHLATAAGARALGLAEHVGTIAPGRDATFLAWEPPRPLAEGFDAARFVLDLVARARVAGFERARPAHVVVRGGPVA